MADLGDIADFKNGKALSKDRYLSNGQWPVFGSNGEIARTDDVLNSDKVISIGRVGAYCGAVYAIRTKSWVTDNAIIAEPKEGTDFDFLYYLLSSLQLNRTAIGSAQPLLTQSGLKVISVERIPNLEQQKQIGKTLKSLDEKIQLNNQINETLESMAQAIFKEWFIDFGPVKDKAEGKKPFGMDDETASLFPDSFEKFDFGKTPKGWGVSKLGDILSVKHGYAFKGEHFSESPTNNILLTPGNFNIGGGFKGDKLKYYNGPEIDDYLLKQNDLVITMTDLSKVGDTLGYPALIPETPPNRYFHNQRIGLVKSKLGGSEKLWVYQLLRTENYRSWILGSCTGSTVKHTSPTRIEEFKFINPGSELMSLYSRFINPIFETISANNLENQTLGNIRDLLLPKLISGEIQIKDSILC